MNLKYLYRTAIAFSFMLFLFSCEKDNFDIKIDSKSNSRQVSSSQAKAFTNMLSNNFFTNEEGGAKLKSTKADENRNVGNMQYIISDLGDTLLYAINFGNDNGYMLLSGDKGSFPIIAFVDSGSVYLNSLDVNSPLAGWLNEKKEEIAKAIVEPIDTLNSNYQLWNGIGNDSCEVSIEFVKTIPQAQLKSAGTRKHSTNKATVYPFTGSHYKWGQGTGYNFNAPVSGALAGCPAVAVGLLCVHHWYPYQFGYMYMPSSLPSNYNQQNAISLMFREIGNQIPGYSWSVSGSGAAPENTLIGLRNLGYRDAQLKTYEFEEAYNNLNSGNPILLRGNAGSYNGTFYGGHIWFCDGYYEMSWKVTKTTKFLGIKVKTETWYEYADYIYMNWGWDGNTNGWYEQSNWTAGGINVNKQMYTNLYPVFN